MVTGNQLVGFVFFSFLLLPFAFHGEIRDTNRT